MWIFVLSLKVVMDMMAYLREWTAWLKGRYLFHAIRRSQLGKWLINYLSPMCADWGGLWKTTCVRPWGAIYIRVLERILPPSRCWNRSSLPLAPTISNKLSMDSTGPTFEWKGTSKAVDYWTLESLCRTTGPSEWWNGKETPLNSSTACSQDE